MKKKQVSVLFILPLVATLISFSTGIIFSIKFGSLLLRSVFVGISALIFCIAVKAIVTRYLPELLISEGVGGISEGLGEEFDTIDDDDVHELNRNVFTQSKNLDSDEDVGDNVGVAGDYSMNSETNDSTTSFPNAETEETFTSEPPEILARAIQTVLRRGEGENTA